MSKTRNNRNYDLIAGLSEVKKCSKVAPMKYSFYLSLLVSLGVVSSSSGAIWSSGHGDIGIGFENGQLDPHFHFHGEEDDHDDDHGDDHDDDHGDDHDDDDDHEHGEEEHAVINGAEPTQEEYGIDELTLQVLGPAQPGAGIADSGAALVYLLAQDEGLADELGSPWTGIAVEEIDQGVFLNDLVRLSLVSVSGPGVFSLWDTDAFGGDSVLISSALGSEAPNQLNLALEPGHYHYNMGFSEPGAYGVTLRAEGDLVAGGIASEEFTVTFDVVPEPSSLFLLALGAVATLRRRRA